MEEYVNKTSQKDKQTKKKNNKVTRNYDIWDITMLSGLGCMS